MQNLKMYIIQRYCIYKDLKRKMNEISVQRRDRKIKKEKKDKKKQLKQIGLNTAEPSEKTRAWNARVHSIIYYKYS